MLFKSPKDKKNAMNTWKIGQLRRRYKRGKIDFLPHFHIADLGERERSKNGALLREVIKI